MKRPDVLIVGGGPVGLMLAIELGQQSVTCELVDMRQSPGRLPKMERCNARTMEFFRREAIADEIRVAGYDNDLPMDVFVCVESVTRPPLVHHPYPSVNGLKARGRSVNDGTMPLEPYQLISQYTLEPLLKAAAERTPGVTVRFGHELLAFEDRGDHMAATIRSDAGLEVVEASYLVGCDGGSSRVRQALGIELRGDSLMQLCQALFRCDDLYERIPIGKGRHYHLADDRSTFLIVQDDTKHFTLHAVVDEEAEMPALFESVAGMPVTFETLYAGKWTQRLMVADTYGAGRVFLAGDAAHLMIPTGGLGMNTGAGDAVDLAWKLAGTVHGWGGPGLLESYEIERRQVGIRNVAASRRAADGRRKWRSAWEPAITEDSPDGERARTRLAEIADREQRWSNDLYGIELGYRYQGSPLIVDEPGGPDPDNFEYVPTTWPGARLPHVWLPDGTALQDRLGRCYTMLHSSPREPAVEMLRPFFEELGAPFASLRLEPGLLQQVLGPHPLILVRPDLHVAWRGQSFSDPRLLVRRVTGWPAQADRAQQPPGRSSSRPSEEAPDASR